MAINGKENENNAQFYSLKYSEIIAAEPFNVMAFFVICDVLVIFFFFDLIN